MKPLYSFRKAIAALTLICAALLAPASGLITDEALSVVRIVPARTSGARGKQLATLQSYLLTNRVTVGVATGESADDWKLDAIQRGIDVWSESISDSPFTLAKPGEKPMIQVRFVRDIRTGGDIQGQIEATRYLKWGNAVSYRLEGDLQVKTVTGRRNLRDDELTEVIAHELGHILGLDDVDECVGLMGPFVPGRARLRPSRDEIQAVADYRDQLRDAIARIQQSN